MLDPNCTKRFGYNYYLSKAVIHPRNYERRREDKDQRTNPPYRPYTHRNPSKDILRSTPRSVVPKRVECQSYVLNFINVEGDYQNLSIIHQGQGLAMVMVW